MYVVPGVGGMLAETVQLVVVLVQQLVQQLVLSVAGQCGVERCVEWC